MPGWRDGLHSAMLRGDAEDDVRDAGVVLPVGACEACEFVRNRHLPTWSCGRVSALAGFHARAMCAFVRRHGESGVCECVPVCVYARTRAHVRVLGAVYDVRSRREVGVEEQLALKVKDGRLVVVDEPAAAVTHALP